jgi:hypothetical protein
MNSDPIQSAGVHLFGRQLERKDRSTSVGYKSPRMRLERQVSDAIVVDLLSLQLSRSYPIAHRHLQTAMHQRTEKDPSQIVLTRANARACCCRQQVCLAAGLAMASP